MSVKLIALDLDGTLNNERKEIMPKTRGTLMDAQQRRLGEDRRRLHQTQQQRG